MNLVYFGSPQFSAEILESILVARPPAYVVCGVVTSPDKPTGRKQELTTSPVAKLAARYDLPVFKPEKLDGANLTHLKLLKPDIFLVVSYGQFIPQSWLEAPTHGCYNIHFSLLPKYRGALCISEAIKNQDQETGVTLMKMDDKLDHGPIIAQSKVSIDINDNVADLTKKLTQAAILLLNEYLPMLVSSPSHPQDDSLASYTPLIRTRGRASAFVPWSEIEPCLAQSKISNLKSPILHALIRSLNPDPGAWTKIDNLELKIIKTKLKDKVLEIDTVQLPGKKPISWQQFTSGH